MVLLPKKLALRTVTYSYESKKLENSVDKFPHTEKYKKPLKTSIWTVGVTWRRFVFSLGNYKMEVTATMCLNMSSAVRY